MDLQDGKRMFGDIKSKLGFGSKNSEPYDEPYDDAYDDYDEYSEYADDYDDGYDDRYAPTSRAAGRAGADSTMPRLVSIDDVRATTQMPAHDPLPTRRASQSAGASAPSRSLGRTMVDSSLPPQMTPEGTAAVSAAASRRRSEGLDSLFSPTDNVSADDMPRDAARADVARTASHADAAPRMGAHAAPAAAPSYTGRRTLTVLKPVTYEDASRVAPALRAGEVVVLALGNTPEALMKRLLDFSFGAASALDASVECIGDKVFAIACGSAVSEVERMNLRNQGVL